MSSDVEIPRLKRKYREQIVPALQEEFKYANVTSGSITYCPSRLKLAGERKESSTPLGVSSARKNSSATSS